MNKMNFVSIWFFLFTSFGNANVGLLGQKPQAQIFQIESSKNKTFCTATLFRPSPFRCALITNAHCIGAGEPAVKLSETFHGLPSIDLHRPEVLEVSKNPIIHKVSVLKISTSMDLAELSIPKEIEEFYCESNGLKVTKSLSPRALADDNIGLISTGFVNGAPHFSIAGTSTTMITSLGIVSWPHVPGSTLEIYKTEIAEMPEILKVHDLKVYKGMSGGAIVNTFKHFMGVNVWVRNHGISQSFFIPTIQINQFLSKVWPKRIDEAESSIQLKIIPTGGNGHANGGSGVIKSESLDFVSKIEDFFFPNEGIISPADPKHILLGMNGHSVDGNDDFKRLNAHFPNTKQILKTNAPSSFPDLDIRKSFWERTSGHFESHGVGAFSRSYLYVVNDISKGYHKDLNKIGLPEVSIKISPELSQITLKMAAHFFRDRMNPSFIYQVTDIEFNFSLISSDDYKTLILRPVDSNLLKENLNCTNDQFLKINCSSDEAVLSLHMVKPNQLEFLYVVKLANKTILNQIFAELKRSN